jgi:DNA polymerase (family 10)
MNNKEIAKKFFRLADVMEIRGDDHFRIRSYRNAAEIIEDWPTPLSRIAEAEGAKGLQALPGIGKAISGKIIEILAKGTFDAWEKLKTKTPESVLELLDVDSIGIRTAATLYQKFQVTSLDDLKAFVAGGGLSMVDGIGEKSAIRIEESISRL